MRPKTNWAPASLLAVLLSSCGYVGDPLPPVLNVPVAVTDCEAVQVGEQIRVRFTLPERTTEETIMRAPGAVELRIGAEPAGGDWREWEAQALVFPLKASAFGKMETSVEASGFVNSVVRIAVRSAGPSGRFSQWSNAVIFPVVAPLPAVSGLRAESDAAGARISWSWPENREGASFLVFKKRPEETSLTLAGETTESFFIDDQAVYGVTLQYSVQPRVRAGAVFAYGEMAGLVVVTPEDRFPPPVPSALAALAGLNTIELNWDRVSAPDLAGYRVYREAGGGKFEPVSELLPLPGFSDKSVEPGRTYRYRVTSVDLRGNESRPSEPVEATAP